MSREPDLTHARKVTVRTLRRKRRQGLPISMVTAYDYPAARLADRAEMDMILVGDSLAMVVLGHADTLSVTMDEMLHHARAVSRGARRALLIGDLPFMSYQASVSEAVRNAGRFLQEAGMDAVKLEGGERVAPQAEAIAGAGIPVMGHLGLTPQSVNALGGWRVQGRTVRSARELLEDALVLQEAGCFSIVLESVPDRLAGLITDRLSIPTIGIGAGREVNGQVLVFHDLLGMYDRLTPRFTKRYAEVSPIMLNALVEYRREVERGVFPTDDHAYAIKDETWTKLCAALEVSEASEPSEATLRRAEGS